MASALLASRNEPCWGEGKVYMRKNPNSNPNWRPNPNPKHKSKPTPPPSIYDPSSLRKSDEPASVAPAVSDDSSSLNRKFANRRDSSHGRYVSFNISAFSRRELKDLKRRLVSELHQVRSLSDRIESRDFQSRSGYSTTGGGFGGREVTSLTTRQQPLALELLENDGREMVMKGSGSKRSLNPMVAGRDPKRVAMEPVASAAAVAAVQPATERLLADMMKKCNQLLTKLMKQKNCWIFNKPVDVVGMGLHDYNHIIKHPMDLGTVKTKLKANQYGSPLEFASDVRLTFNNALTYNPSSHEVYIYAETLLSSFELMFEPAYRSYEDERQNIVSWAEKMKQQTQTVPKKGSRYVPPAHFEQHKEMRQSIEEREIRRHSASMMDDHKEMGDSPPQWNQNRRFPPQKRRPPEAAPLPPPVVQAPAPVPQPAPAPPQAQAPAPSASASIRTMGGRQPKPRAKDKNKRDMSFEEKQKLSLCLQNLPMEKMGQVVHIIKKRNLDLAQQGDEIEVDIEAVDTETLWELDRFVGYYRKTMSKIKRQELAVANQNPGFDSGSAPPALSQGQDKEMVEEEMHNEAVASSATKKTRKGENGGGGGGDEEIDIGEDMPANNFPPVEIEKDVGGGGYASRSSSSSSSSSSDDDSSSSDSDSGSSSGSDSDDGDNAQSMGGRGMVESKAAEAAAASPSGS